MTETGFPDTHTTTTTTTGSVVYLDLGVLRSLPGIIKIAEMALDLLGFICIISSLLSHSSRGTWFNTVSMGGFWYSAILLAFYVFHVPERLSFIPWKKIEFVFCAVWTFFYIVAASLCANYGWEEAFAAAAFFGYSAMVVYGIDAFISFKQISGVIIKTTTTTTTSHPTSPTQY